MRIHDISIALTESVPTWPGSPGYRLHMDKDFPSDGVMNTRLEMDVHVGTHIDAPLHVLEGATPVDGLDLHPFIGPAFVADLRGRDRIDLPDLAEAVPDGTTRLLLKTDNEARWTSSEFDPTFVALTPEAARWLVDAGVQLIANDYLSIQRYLDGADTHEVLLRAGVVIVEGVDLRGVSQGAYDLACLPLNLVGAEGAPARAVLIER